jgi:hypothetical protein
MLSLTLILSLTSEMLLWICDMILKSSMSKNLMLPLVTVVLVDSLLALLILLLLLRFLLGDMVLDTNTEFSNKSLRMDIKSKFQITG